LQVRQKQFSGFVLWISFIKEKTDTNIILYEYERIKNLSKIVNDYLARLGDTVNELQKLTGQLQEEYTKNSLSKA